MQIIIVVQKLYTGVKAVFLGISYTNRLHFFGEGSGPLLTDEKEKAM